MKVFMLFLFLFIEKSYAQRDEMGLLKFTNDKVSRSFRSITTSEGEENQKDCDKCLQEHRECDGLLKCEICESSCGQFENGARPSTPNTLIVQERKNCQDCLKAHRECKTLLECKVCHVACEVFEEDAIPTSRTTTITTVAPEKSECTQCLKNNPQCKNALKCDPCKKHCKTTEEQVKRQVDSRCRLCMDGVRCRRYGKCDHCKKYCDLDDANMQKGVTVSTEINAKEQQTSASIRKSRIPHLAQRNKQNTLREAEVNAEHINDNYTTTTEHTKSAEVTTRKLLSHIQSLISSARKSGSIHVTQRNKSGVLHEVERDVGNRDADEELETSTENIETTTGRPSHLMDSLLGKSSSFRLTQRNKSGMLHEAERNIENVDADKEIQATTTENLQILETTTRKPSDRIESLVRAAKTFHLAQRNKVGTLQDETARNIQSDDVDKEIQTTTSEYLQTLETTTSKPSSRIKSLISSGRKSIEARLAQIKKHNILNESDEDDTDDDILGAVAPTPENCDPILVFPAVSGVKDMKGADLPQTAPRYYTIGAFRRGPRLNHFLHLLNVQRIDDIEKVIVIAKLRANQSLSENEPPIIIDYSKLIRNTDAHVGPGNKIKGPDVSLSYEIEKALQMAAQQKNTVQGVTSLTPDETFKVIEHAISLHNAQEKGQTDIVAQTPAIPVRETEALIDEGITPQIPENFTQTSSIPTGDLVREELEKPSSVSAPREQEEIFIEEILPSAKPLENIPVLPEPVVASPDNSPLHSENLSQSPLETRLMKEAERSLSTTSAYASEETYMSTRTQKTISTEHPSIEKDTARDTKIEEPMMGLRNKEIDTETTTSIPENEISNESRESSEEQGHEIKLIEKLKKTLDDHKKALTKDPVADKQKLESVLLEKLKEMLHGKSDEENVGMEEETTLKSETTALVNSDKQRLVETFTSVITNDLTGKDNLSQAKKEEIEEEVSKLLKSTVEAASSERASENVDNVNKNLDKIEGIVDTAKIENRKKLVPSKGMQTKKGYLKKVVFKKPSENVGNPFIIQAEDFTTLGSTSISPKKIVPTEKPSGVATQSNLAKDLIAGVTDVPEYVMKKMKSLMGKIPAHSLKIPDQIVGSKDNNNKDVTLGRVSASKESKYESTTISIRKDLISEESTEFMKKENQEPTLSERQQKYDTEGEEFIATTLSSTEYDDSSEEFTEKTLHKPRINEEEIVTELKSSTGFHSISEYERTTIKTINDDDSNHRVAQKIDWTEKDESKDSFESLNTFGKIVPAKDSSNVVHHNFPTGLKAISDANFYGDMELPLRLKYYPDGTIKLGIDKKKYCQCSDSQCDIHSNVETKVKKSDDVLTWQDKDALNWQRDDVAGSFEETAVGMSLPTILNRNAEINKETPTSKNMFEEFNNTDIKLERVNSDDIKTNTENQTSISSKKPQTMVEGRDRQMIDKIEPLNDTVEQQQNLQSKRESTYMKRLRERKNKRLNRLEKKKTLYKRSPLLQLLGSNEDSKSNHEVDLNGALTKRHLDGKDVVQQKVGLMTNLLSWMKNLATDKKY